MPKRFLRPLLIVEFLIALQVFYTMWSQVGGQYHLDLMFWPWKLVIGVLAAGLITGITASILANDGEITRRALMLGSLLLVTLGTAGIVTYYYHLNEPTEQQDEEDDQPAKVSNIRDHARGYTIRRVRSGRGLLPGLAGLAAADHRQTFLAAESFLKLRHVRDCPIHAVPRNRVRVGLRLQPFDFGCRVLAPDLTKSQKELLRLVVSAQRRESLAAQIIHESQPGET